MSVFAILDGIINRHRERRGAAGDVAGDHDGGAEFAQGTGEGQEHAGENATPGERQRDGEKYAPFAGAVWAFARALGEFGATIMVAGNIPGRTTTLPVAIYQAVENGEDMHAWTLAAVSAAIAFAAVFVSETLLRRRP